MPKIDWGDDGLAEWEPRRRRPQRLRREPELPSPARSVPTPRLTETYPVSLVPEDTGRKPLHLIWGPPRPRESFSQP